MEKFRPVPHTHMSMSEAARTERSLFLADALRDFMFAAVFRICSFPYGNVFFPLTSTHKPCGFCCSFQNIWCIH